MSVTLYSKKTEQKLLGLLINDSSLIWKVQDKLSANDFHSKDYKMTFIAILKTYEQYKNIEVARLVSYLEETNEKDQDDWYSFVSDLIISAGVPSDLETYVEIIKDKSDKRNLQHILEEQVKSVTSREVPMDELVRSIEGEIFKATRTRENHDFKSMEEVTTEYTTEITSPKEESKVKSGYSELDKIIPSFNPGQFVIVAARPSMGKTAFSLALATNFAKENNVAYFSIEMPRKQIVERMLSSETLLSSNVIANPTKWSDQHKETIELVIPTINELKLFIDDSPQAKLGNITWKSRMMKEQGKLDVIVIDYLGLITHEINGRRVEPKAVEVSEISRQLKSLARELEVPVIALSQLNRSVEQRENKRPMMSDLRDSGSLEQDADIIMFLYRDEYYLQKNNPNPIKKETEDLEVIVSKNRNGATGKAILKFMMATGRIYDTKPAKEEEE